MSIALCFNDVALSPIPHANQTWIRSADLARALAYSDERKISHLYSRHSDEFTSDMSLVLNLGTSGNPTDATRIFSLRGCHLIAMFARTPVAKQFRRWVLDVLDKLAAEERAQLPADVNPQSLTPAQQAQIHAIVAAKVGMLPRETQRKAYAEIWSRFGRHFQVAKYQQLPPARMGEAVEYLVGVELKVAQKALPVATAVVPLPASDAMNEVEQRIIALHTHVVKERHAICRDMGLAVWQTYGGDVLASMFHAIYTCVDKAIIDPSTSLSSYDLPVDLARRIAGLRDSAGGAKMQGA